MTTTPPTPAANPPAEDPQERKVIDLMKKAYTEMLAEQEQTRTQPEPEKKTFLQQLFG